MKCRKTNLDSQGALQNQKVIGQKVKMARNCLDLLRKQYRSTNRQNWEWTSVNV